MKFINLLLLLLLGSLWGPSFMFIKIVIQELSPLLFVTTRIVLAAVLINLFLYFKGERLPNNFTFWKHATIAGFFAQAFPFLLFSWGEQFIDSSLASIINGLTPLFTILLANFFIQEEEFTAAKIVGVIMGFIGLLVLLYPNITTGLNATVEGIIAVSIGAASYGVGIIYSRKYLKNTKQLHAPSAQLASASIYLILASLILDQPNDILGISLKAAGSILILSLFGTAIAFVLYFKVLQKTSASFLSMVNYLMPVYGLLLGVLFLNESITIEVVLGMLLIFAGIIISTNLLTTVRVKSPAQVVQTETCIRKPVGFK